MGEYLKTHIQKISHKQQTQTDPHAVDYVLLCYIFDRLSALSVDSGVVIPGKLHLYGICINSVQLMESSCVISNKRTCGFRIAPYINDYQVQVARNLLLSFVYGVCNLNIFALFS